MHDIIYIEGLKTAAIIGIYDWEKEQRQPLIFDIEMSVPIANAAKSDQIEDTVDYKSVADFIIEWVSNSRFDLLETLLEQLSEELFARFRAIHHLKIKIGKPQAVPQAKTVGLIIQRSRQK
ncbi:dihydroneopterin aldolase [Thiomicrorhabdus sp. 6S3-12]|uniref:dihydroneopterin aldolase n=1 Tax=Thiomicrorhabdus sp. 6S3-12 TaxID=2819681 RepID=UPI001AADF27A|nr:dihydroneopterin aldolase [Thiomicrorhabdus sp. 6S3-12]